MIGTEIFEFGPLEAEKFAFENFKLHFYALSQVCKSIFNASRSLQTKEDMLSERPCITYVVKVLSSNPDFWVNKTR